MPATDGRQINFYCEGAMGNEDYGRKPRPHPRRDVASFLSDGTWPDGRSFWASLPYTGDSVELEHITRDAETGVESGPEIDHRTRIDLRAERDEVVRARYVIVCDECGRNVPILRARLTSIAEGITAHSAPVADGVWECPVRILAM